MRRAFYMTAGAVASMFSDVVAAVETSWELSGKEEL